MAFSDIMIENPYASPTVDDFRRLPARLTIPRMLALLSFGIVGGAGLGALTNSVNGALSPQYFRDVMDWSGSHIWIFAVGQGALEGAAYGLVFGIVFIALISTISRRQCDLQAAMRYARFTFALVFCCWLLGGVIAVGFATLFPNLCDSRSFGNDFTWPALGCYAWVRGSIWGVVFGGFCSVFLINAMYAFRLRSANLLESELRKAACPGDDPGIGADEAVCSGDVDAI